MQTRSRSLVLAAFATISVGSISAQCTLTNATSCVCATAGQTDCDLLPDMTISWSALANVDAGPTEYSQTNSSNPGRLRVSGSTPNIGKGNLEVRGVSNNQRAFICGTDTILVSGGQQNFTCQGGISPKQVLYQRIYHKNGNVMSYQDVKTGTMTYHPNHAHYHVDDWTTMTLRIQDPSEPLHTKWPIVATGANIGFCLMDYYDCWSSSASGHCRTSQEWQQGSVLNAQSQFPNRGMYNAYDCNADYQGISTGRTDLYGEWLEGMWINLMPNLCNGNYWIVAEVDPTNVFREENENNNWTAMPFTVALQRAANSGGSAFIHADKRPIVGGGRTVTLTAAPGNTYLWNTGATTRSITVSAAGSYSCTVSAPCGTLLTGNMVVTAMAAPAAPTATGATVVGPAAATLQATGNDPQWYTAATGGEAIATGTSFTTPVLASSTTYYVSDRATTAGTTWTAGKTFVPGHGSNYNGRQWMLFDAYEPFVLKSVRVMATGLGNRHFVLVDNVGNLIAEKQIELLAGDQIVELNFRVPKGVQHKISAYDSGAVSSGTQLVFQDLHRSTTNVAYPYAIGTVGSITGSTLGSSVYLFFYDWEVSTEAAHVESARVPVTAEVVNGVVLDLKAFLDGPFDSNAGMMHDSLRVKGLLPLNEPYAALGFPQVGPGGEQISAAMLNTTGSNAVVDWVRVELRSASTPSVILAAQSAVLTRNGQVISTTGAPLRFSVNNGNYHVAIRHRNHLGVMTAQPVALSAVSTTIDMRSTATQLWGTASSKVAGSTRMLWSGEAVRDGVILYTGANNDRDILLQMIGGQVPTNTVSGYHQSDVNLDGVTKYTGAGNDRDPILANIGGLVPTNSLPQQLP
ncbi:MAG TPA: lysyl oxidase family protein [Flavobacteriales bacterium]|nr:lysyl oxidase family protein [Flavobacteriales bacterium]